MDVTVALFGAGLTILFGLLAVVSWRHSAERPRADRIRSQWLMTFAACLFFGGGAVAVGLQLLGAASPQNRDRLQDLASLIVLSVVAALVLVGCASALAGARERSDTERARRGRGSSPRKRLLAVWVVVGLWLLVTIITGIVVGWIAVATGPAIRSPEDPPRVVAPLVGVVVVGSAGALVSGMWQHHRRRREDDRILRSDMAQAAEISRPPDGSR